MSDEAQGVDWRDMFRRYADRVGDEEGIDFLERYDWPPAEWAEIVRLFPHHPLPLRPWPWCEDGAA